MAVEYWFMLSVFLFVMDKPFLAYVLDRKGVDISFMKSQIPGYVNRKYKQWCREVGKDPSPRLLASWLIVINLVIALAVFVPRLLRVFEEAGIDAQSL